MHERLEKELTRLLLPHAISSASIIFEDYIFASAGIEKPKDARGFNGYGSKLNFELPSVSLDELDKLLTYFHVSKEDYRTNADIVVTEELMFETIIPKFAQYLTQTAQESPEKLTPYRIKSRPSLERIALDNVGSYSVKIKASLNPDLASPSEIPRQFTEIIFQLRGAIEAVSNDRKYVSYIQTTYQKMKGFLESNDVASHLKKHSERIDDLMQELQVYLTYNYAESSMAIRKIFKEMHSFLSTYKIDMRQCNILEHSLWEMAGLTGLPESCKFGHDLQATRLIIRFSGISEENASVFLKYLQKFDETTTCDNRSGRISKLPDFKIDDGVRQQCYAVKNKAFVIKLKPYNFDIDGEVFYKEIAPLFYSRICDASEDSLEIYQQLSQPKPEENPAAELSSSEEKKERIALPFFNVQATAAVPAATPVNLVSSLQ